VSTNLIRAAKETVNALRTRARVVELAGDVYLAAWLRAEANALDAARKDAERIAARLRTEAAAERLYLPERSPA